MSYEVGGRPPRVLVLGTGACALVAVVLAVLLPLAPVLVNSPSVQWPLDPAQPRSTLLSLTSYRPAELDVRFSCRATRAAAEAGPPGTVVSTVNPVLPEVAELGLIARVVRTTDGTGTGGTGTGGSSDPRTGTGATGTGVELIVDAVGSRLARERVPTGDCSYVVHGDPRDGLVLTRDGVPLGRGPVGVLPDVDLLATSVTTLPGAVADDLDVQMRLDDEFASTPTVLKRLQIVLLLIALVAVGLGLWRLDRTVSRVPLLRRVPLPHPADAVVVLTMLGWLLLAPATDDDGYYAAMAANAEHTGYVGNYYQLYDQSFTPITWFYQVLGWWQGLAGTAPVTQRMISLAAGLLTWLVVRTLLGGALRPAPGEHPVLSRPVRLAAPLVAAVAFLAWWLPQDMGVRPESMVALLAVAGMLAVSLAVRRRSLVAAWAACAAAGLALATHTTGFVGFAPLVAGLGGLWTLVRVPGSPARTAARAVAVVSGGTTAALAGFADGSLRDFLRAQQIFLDMQPREYWYTEYLRWGFLLGEGAMGNYAKRVAILVALVGLVWFLALAAASRARGEPLPGPLRLSAWSLVAGFGLLWLTPSKWTHHFGALAGIGPVFLTLLLVTAIPATRRALGGQRIPPALLAVAAGSVLVALTLAGHGRNSWPYAWMYGFPDPNTPPDAGPFTFSSPLTWLVVLAGCVGLTWGWSQLRDARRKVPGGGPDRVGTVALRAVTLLVVAGLGLNVTYLVGSFALAARNTGGKWSFWAANVDDPRATRCGAADAISVYDPFTGRPLEAVSTVRSGSGVTVVPTTGARPATVTRPAAATRPLDAGPAPATPGATPGAGPAPATPGGGPAPASPHRAQPVDPDSPDAPDDPRTQPDPRSRTGRTQPPEPGTGSGQAGAARTGFERDGGYYLGYQPAVPLGTGAATEVWGSLLGRDGEAPDRNTGEMRTGWYRLPDTMRAEEAVGVLVAGSPGQGNSLTAEYARTEGSRLVPLEEPPVVGIGTGPERSAPLPAPPDVDDPDSTDPDNTDPDSDTPDGPDADDPDRRGTPAPMTVDLDDKGRDPRWRTVLLDPPPGARLVRLHAVDGSAGSGGWLAFAAPAVQPLVPLDTMVGGERPVALSWQVAFQYPCLRQPIVRKGVTEPATAALLWADAPFAGTRDGTWQPFRGGLYGQVQRSQSVLQLVARVRGQPAERRLEVLLFDSPLARDGYRLTTEWRLANGWAETVPTPTRTLNPLERCTQHSAATHTPTADCVPTAVR